MEEHRIYLIIGAALLSSCFWTVCAAAQKHLSIGFTPESLNQRCARKFDEYGDIRSNDTKARLDNFAIKLHNEPSSKGYMLFYGGRRGRAGHIERRLIFERSYLIQIRGIPDHRLIGVLGGYQEAVLTELWIVPRDCRPPSPSPTVPESQVVFLAHPDVSPQRLLLIQTLVREFGPLMNPILRREGGSGLDEWDLEIVFFNEKGGWAWVEIDQSEEGGPELRGWALLKKVVGRWRVAQKKVVEDPIDTSSQHEQFIRSVMQKYPEAPRAIFNFY